MRAKKRADSKTSDATIPIVVRIASVEATISMMVRTRSTLLRARNVAETLPRAYARPATATASARAAMHASKIDFKDA